MDKKSRTKVIISAVILVVLMLIVIIYYQTLKHKLVSTALFACDANKTINVSYFNDNSVSLVLSDGRVIPLMHDGDNKGTNYTDPQGIFELINNGDRVNFLESNEQTYSGCIAVSKNTDRRN